VKPNLALLAAALSALSACGGGGGSEAPPVANLQSAKMAAQVLSPTFAPATLTASDNGVTLTLSVDPVPQPAIAAVTCGGMSEPYTDTTTSFTASNWSVFFPDDEQAEFYSSDPYTPCGGLYASLGGVTQTYVVTSYTPPAMWTVGEAGQLATETNYSASGSWFPPSIVSITIGAQVSTDVISYQVTASSPDAVTLTLTDANSVNGTTTQVFSVTADGMMTLQSVTLATATQTITLTD
jgi:hypothetical protein